VARAPFHEQKDDAFGFGRMMPPACPCPTTCYRFLTECTVLSKYRFERQQPKPTSGILQHPSAVDLPSIGVWLSLGVLLNLGASGMRHGIDQVGFSRIKDSVLWLTC
jgi:hypothetical protein